MTFLEDKRKPKNSYFECRRSFSPSKAEIEIGIDGDIAGPTERQKEFFRQIESDYDTVISAAIPALEDEFRNWKEDFKIKNFQEEFKPVYLRLPRCEEKPIAWEVAFETELDLNHSFTLKMKNFEVMGVFVDG